MESEQLRSILQWAYILDFSLFNRIYYPAMQKDWTAKKWTLMQKDFTQFYCSLNEEEARAFVQAWQEGQPK